MEQFLTPQNLVVLVSLIAAIFFLRSGVVKQLIDHLKQLGSVQEGLLKAKDEEIVKLNQEIDRMKDELEEEKVINKRLRRYEDEAREEIERLKRLQGEK